jgi:hypothetical protein
VDVRSAAQTVHARSIAILIGVADADHTDHELRPVPATLNSLRAMQRVLTDPNLGGWPGDRVTVLRNPEDAGRTARHLRDLLRSARDTLLVYYAGEASLTAAGQLCLALHDTEPDAPDRTGLSYSWLARALRDSPARRKVVVLDCSLPGRAGQYLDPVSDQIAELSDVEGVYTITSTTRHHPAPVTNAVHQRPRPTVFTGQLVEIIESGVPGAPLDLTFEDLYPALRQRLVSMGLPPPNQRGTGGTRPLLLARNMAPRSAGAAAAVPAPETSARSGSGSAPGRTPAAATLSAGPDAGPALLSRPDPAAPSPSAPPDPSARRRPGNGTRPNGHGPTGAPTTGLATGPTTGPTPAVSPRPITGQTPAIGARPIAGPEPPRRTPGSKGTPPPPPPTATPLPGSPDSDGAAPSAATSSTGAGKDRDAGSSSRTGPSRSERSDRAEGDGDGEDQLDDDGQSSGAGSRGTRARPGRRRRTLPALALAVALLVPALYVIRPWGKGGGSGDGVDLREIGNRTISLGRGARPVSLIEDDDTLWVQSGADGRGVELTKIDLTSGEIVDSVPFPDSAVVSAITAGAGSLWVTTSSAESMGGEVLRIDPETGDELARIELPAWTGRAAFAADSLWVATVVQPAAAEIGATGGLSSAANALQRIDPETDELVTSIQLDAKPLDVSADDGLVLVSTVSAEGTSVVAIDPATEAEVARIPVPAADAAEADPDADLDAAGPWVLFVTDPYAVRVDVDAEAVAAITGARDGIDLVVPNGEQMWELHAEALTLLDGEGQEVVTVTVDGTPLAAAAAGRDAAWIAYRPAGEDDVVVTRVPAATLIDLAD